MTKLQNPFPYIQEQLKYKSVNIPLTCPLCGRDAKADYAPKAIPFITIHCPNCVKYSVQEDFFECFDDTEHSYLLSGDIRHTQKDMDGHFISADSANDAIAKQKALESENRSLSYLVWQYDQISGSWDGWKEYIYLPAVAYCKNEDELQKLTEKAVKLGYLEEKDGRYKATVAGMRFSKDEILKETEIFNSIVNSGFNVTEVHPRKKYDVFISHANKDKLVYVDLLNSTVKRLGINVFYDSDVLSWGDKWKQVILDGTASSEFAIIVISQNFFDREWTERELHEFLTRQNGTGQKIVLPLLYGITLDQLKDKYPELGDIQCIKAEDFTKEEIVILLARELIKRYK